MVTESSKYQERIITDPEILVGKPVIKGTRISVELVLEYLARNPNFDEFFTDYPDLTMADVQAVLAYARDLVAGEKVALTPRHHEKRRAVHPSV